MPTYNPTCWCKNAIIQGVKRVNATYISVFTNATNQLYFGPEWYTGILPASELGVVSLGQAVHVKRHQNLGIHTSTFPLLNKPWSQMSSLLPPFLAFNFNRAQGSVIPLLVDFSSSVANSRSRAIRKSLCAQEKVLANLYEYARVCTRGDSNSRN